MVQFCSATPVIAHPRLAGPLLLRPLQISHFPYEETDLHGVIETHQWWSLGVTGLFVGLTVWRWTTRRRGSDAGGSLPFLAVTILGTLGLVMSGMTGGDLVFDYGINVRGTNPLLAQ